MEKNLPSMNPLLKIWMPSFSSHILMPHGKEDSMKTPMDSSDSTSRKKLNSTISRISKSSRWWKNSITVQENAWEWKHQIRYSSRIIHLSHFGVESTEFWNRDLPSNSWFKKESSSPFPSGIGCSSTRGWRFGRYLDWIGWNPDARDWCPESEPV